MVWTEAQVTEALVAFVPTLAALHARVARESTDFIIK
jgi:hypothetical protein